jgi:hypothetical protein
MSLSEMSKTTYKAHSSMVRANGAYHGYKWIACPLEREDMKFLDNQAYDHLLQRVAFRTLGEVETPRNAFMLTTPFKG